MKTTILGHQPTHQSPIELKELRIQRRRSITTVVVDPATKHWIKPLSDIINRTVRPISQLGFCKPRAIDFNAERLSAGEEL